MKALNIDELTVEQKIGQLLMVRGFIDDEDREFIYHMMENKSVGSIQIPPTFMDCEKEIEEIRKHADYPILIFSDMEDGFPTGSCRVPSAMALSITGDEELAYQLGAATAIESTQYGYNMAGGPVVDLLDGDQMLGLSRSFGSDLNHVCKMTSAVLRGEQDYGLIGIMKHFPSPPDIRLDGHVFEDITEYSEQDILDTVMVPYLYAMEHAGLKAVMTTHTYIPKVDDTYPTSLSEKIVGLLRKQGYDGLLITDSFAMMGILQKFGEEQCYGLSVKAGHDIVLPNYRVPFKTAYEYLLNAYRKGVFSEERLNEAVGRVLAAQKSIMEPERTAKLTEYHRECMETIEKESICVIKDESTPAALDKKSRKLFVLAKENFYQDDSGVPYEIMFPAGINDDNIEKVRESILAKFPGSQIRTVNQYPCPQQVEAVLNAALHADEIIFVTFSVTIAYSLGSDLNPRMVYLMKAVKDKLAAVVHLGNPYPLEAAPHFPRTVISIGGRENMIDRCLSVLNGEYVPKGKLPFELNLQ